MLKQLVLETIATWAASALQVEKLDEKYMSAKNAMRP